MRRFKPLRMSKIATRVGLVIVVFLGLCWFTALPAAAKLVVQGAAADINQFNGKLQDCSKASKSFKDLVDTITKDPINIVTVRLVRKSTVIIDSFGNEEVDLDDLAQLPLKPAGAGDESATQCQVIAHFLQERYSAWKQADKRLMDNGKTISWVALTFPDTATQQDADVGTPVKKLKYHDANGNGTWDFGEPIYEDLNNNNQVDENEVRVLEGGGFAAGMKLLVAKGDADVGKKLSLSFQTLEQFGYVDDDKNGTWTEGDPIYIESHPNNGGRFTVVNPTLSFGRASDDALDRANRVRTDLGQKAKRVANDSREEFIYRDEDNSGTVSANDIRLTARGPSQVKVDKTFLVRQPQRGIAFVWLVTRIRRDPKVKAGDRDIGRKLTKFRYDDTNNNNRHDNIPVGQLHFPEPLYDDRDGDGQVSSTKNKEDIRVTGARSTDLLLMTVTAGQADVNRRLTLAPFGFEDAGGNKTWDWTLDEEPLYQDSKKANDGKADPGDRRVMGSWVWQPSITVGGAVIAFAGFTHRKGYEPKSQVQAGHLDVGQPLKGVGRLRYHDVNRNNAWDSGEAVYRKATLLGRAQVEVGDMRVSERFLAFRLVLRGEPDDNRALIPLYFEDLNGNGSWDEREPRYADDDGNKQVSVGDERLDIRFIEATTVVANDPDLKRVLKVAPHGYDDINGANGWEFENSVANMNFDDGSSETWYLVNGNIVKRVRTP